MRQLFFGLLVSITTISGSAFINKNTKHDYDYYYYIMDKERGLYIRSGIMSPNISLCFEGPLYSCVIAFDSDEGPVIDPNHMPRQPDYTTITKGYYRPRWTNN
jgi:hypothetical protein